MEKRLTDICLELLIFFSNCESHLDEDDKSSWEGFCYCQSQMAQWRHLAKIKLNFARHCLLFTLPIQLRTQE